jgi:hypothetical protein
MTRWLAVLLLAGGAATPALAQRVTAMDAGRFIAICEGREASTCEAYIDGTADTIATYHDLTRRPDSPVKVPADVCVPEVSGATLRHVVVDWLRANPAERGKPLHQLVYRALLANYPCR